MKASFSKPFVTALALCVATGVLAQTVPALVNYQGRLANPDGTALATGDYQLTFRVYDSATNSSGLVWGPQIFDGVAGQGHGGKIPVVQGYFNVMLGPVDTNGVSLDSAFTGSNRFVEITITNRPPVLPRQQILSAPFAFNSAKLSGADWSVVFGTNDPVNGKIPTTKLATNGTISAQKIGVGTANPNLQLEVINGRAGFWGPGGADILTLVENPSSSFGAHFTSEGANNTRLVMRHTDGGGIRAQIGTILDTFFNGGNVGIGTTTPQTKLHVIDSSVVVARFEASGQTSAIRLKASGLGGREWNLESTDGSFQIGDVTANADRFHISTNGNVGIGTTSPSSALQVVGTVTATSFNPPSDRDLKQNFRSISPQEILYKVTALPITRWNFIGDTNTHHVGPMAQDFYAAFGVGTDERHIATVDADGVALAAIQGLNQKLEQKLKVRDAEFELLKERLNRLEAKSVGNEERN